MATINVGAGRTFTRLGAISPAPSAGDIILVDPGVYEPAVDADTISWTGTLANPITIRPFLPGFNPIFKRELRLNACSYVVVEEITIHYPTTQAAALASCITINGSGTYNTIYRCRTFGGLVGVQINESAGLGHRIEGCVIQGTKRAAASFTAGNGIAVSKNNYGTGHTRATRCAEIVNNELHSIAGHGMELQGRYGLIMGNTVSGAGLAIRGCSGIHVLNDDRLLENPDDTTVQGYNWHVINNIVYNVKTATEDDGNGTVFLQDGNGIQVDHGCNFVMIQGNICYNNDGAGIAIYDAANGQVWFNSCYNNGRDFDQYHIHRGELMFGSNENVTPTYLGDWEVWGNCCEKLDGAVNNIGFGLVPHVVQLNYNIPVSITTITFDYNNFRNSGGNSDAWRIIGTTYTSIATWNAARETNGGDDLNVAPGWTTGFPDPKIWAVTGSAATHVTSLPSGMIYMKDLLGTPYPSSNAATGAIQ